MVHSPLPTKDNAATCDVDLVPTNLANSLLCFQPNKWCPGGYREYVSGGGHLNACPGLEGIIEACPVGEGNYMEACPGGVEQNRSMSRGHLQVCPGEVEI